jgi:hypothetical protein
MLAFFALSPDGYHYRRLIDAFKRIFAATIFFGTEEQPTSSPLIDWTRFHFLDQMKLWCSPDTTETEGEAEELGSVITLSEAFYNEIDGHRIPVERKGMLWRLSLTLRAFSTSICGLSGKAGLLTASRPESQWLLRVA